MDRLASMRAFVTTADLGSFAATASALDMSPQMVAKHIVFLEDRVGVRLVNRTTRRQSLTEIGRAYYERCRTVLADADWADAVGNEARDRPRGRLRISAPVSFGSTRLMPVVASYLRAHPEVEVDLVLSDRVVDLVEEEFEAAFRIGHGPAPGLVARELAPFRLVACAAGAYLREKGTPREPGDLSRHELLAYARGPASDEWRLVRDGEEHRVRAGGRLRVNDAKALLTAALDGYGIALIAEDLVEEHLAAGRLLRILPCYEAPPRPMHLVHLADRRQPPKLRTFIEATLTAFAAAPATRGAPDPTSPPSRARPAYGHGRSAQAASKLTAALACSAPR